MSKKILPVKWDFRDVSSGIQKIRQFLLGRKYVLHNRFPPLISPRSIPPPDVPRGPEYKYSDQWYGKRDALNSVKPPVVAPIAQGFPASSKQAAKAAKSPCYMNLKSTSKKTESVEFPCPPTPGLSWWFDGHCYFKTVPDVFYKPAPAAPSPPAPPCPPPCPPPVKPTKPCPLEKEPPCPPVKLSASNPCGEDKPPLTPCAKEKPKPCPPPPPPDPCDPCAVPGKGDDKKLKSFLATEDQGPKKKC